MGATSLIVPARASAAPGCPTDVLGINTWYRGLVDGDCKVVPPSNTQPDAVNKFVWTIVLNIIQAALAVAAYVAAFFVVKGGFVYIVAAGSQDKMAEAKNTIKNALIGMVIAMASASIVNAIAGFIK